MLFLYALVLLATVLLTGLIRHYALSRKVLDIPNQRSSHSTPTPRGGGLAIVLAFSSACVYLYLTQNLQGSNILALSSALLVAIIGFIDDHAHVAARWRLLVHLSAAFLALFFLNGLPLLLLPKPLDVLLGQSYVQLGWLGYMPGVLLLVWLLNLFNFMDGTDGIAASEAMFVCSALAGYLFFVAPVLSGVMLCLGFSALGFLCWNWPKARIFMGDVGSGFLGLLLGIMILMAAQQAPVLLYCGLILFGVFVVDASYTLLARMAGGQKWYDAHCSHTYQRAARRYGHLPVLAACWAINLFWLLPVSLLVFRHPGYALFGLILSYLPLIVLAYFFKAGRANAVTG